MQKKQFKQTLRKEEAIEEQKPAANSPKVISPEFISNSHSAHLLATFFASPNDECMSIVYVCVCVFPSDKCILRWVSVVCLMWCVCVCAFV